ncbi:MAG: hypothetical protein AAGA55_07160 [Planctomycetota bacterium]
MRVVGRDTDARLGSQAVWRIGRRIALVLAAGWCVVLGAGMTAVIIDHGSLGQTPTWVLTGAVAMLLLPGLTAIALRFDAGVRRKHRSGRMAAGAATGRTSTRHPPHRGDRGPHARMAASPCTGTRPRRAADHATPSMSAA